MKPGKVSESILKRTVIKQLSNKNKNLINSAAIGNDAALFVVSENKYVLTSTETIADTYEFQKSRALIRAANNVLAGGGIPKFAQISIMLPISATEADLRKLFKEYVDMSKAMGITVSGGHTEVSEYVTTPIVTVIVIGESDKEYSIKNIKPGDDIVMSKAVGLEGSFLLASKQMDFFKTRFANSYIEKSLRYIEDISVAKESIADLNVFADNDMNNFIERDLLNELGATEKRNFMKKLQIAYNRLHKLEKYLRRKIG